MFISDKLDVRLRTCAIPKEEVCPTILKIPKSSEVSVSQELKYHEQSDGKRATWRNVKYNSAYGWVNESLLIDRNCC